MTHEPCLYHCFHNGKEVLFLCQVDDFAVGYQDDEVCKDIINMIDKEMTIDIKDLGIITRFNGLDVTQTKAFTKISNATYIQKIINEHPTMFDNYQPSNHPLPVNDDKTFIKTMETAKPPTSPDEQLKLQVSMQFNYR